MALKTLPEQGERQSMDESATLAGIYHLLALAMRYPDPKTLSNDFPDTMVLLLELLSKDQEKEELVAWKNQSKDWISELQVEYTRLFITSGEGKTPAPPYASVYLDGGMLQGKTTEQISLYYKQHGFQPDNDNEPADHISSQLEFLSLLAARDRHDGNERQFLKNYFRPWFYPFYTKVLDNTRHPFYRVSVQLIDFLTKEEINGN